MMALRWVFIYVLPAALGITAACSADEGFPPRKRGEVTGGGAGTSGTGGGGGDIFIPGSSSGSGGSGVDDCSEETKLVYIIGQDNELYSFHPPTLDVSLRGVINCPSGGATPNSMAVDRKGVAWVGFSDGRIFQVDVKTAACTSTPYEPLQGGFTKFGMGFVSDSIGSAEETLFVADTGGKGLAKIDTATFKLTTIGPWDTLDGAAELTGTGDGRLYGFFSANPTVALIDKASAKILDQAPQPTISIGYGWAFAFWGGEFWLFTSPGGSSRIDRYRPSDGTTVTVKTGLMTTIVGAGVSTCAPVVMPPPK